MAKGLFSLFLSVFHLQNHLSKFTDCSDYNREVALAHAQFAPISRRAHKPKRSFTSGGDTEKVQSKQANFPPQNEAIFFHSLSRQVKWLSVRTKKKWELTCVTLAGQISTRLVGVSPGAVAEARTITSSLIKLWDGVKITLNQQVAAEASAAKSLSLPSITTSRKRASDSNKSEVKYLAGVPQTHRVSHTQRGRRIFHEK